MNNINENQHYVSQVLQKRFKAPNKPLYWYQVETDEWEERSSQRAFAAKGYNQLLAGREDDNWLEAAFAGSENHVRDVCEALEEAARRPVTKLEDAVYRNMCRYCSFLNLISPAAKAAAVPDLMCQLNLELKEGGQHMLKFWQMPDETIALFREEYARGRRMIVKAKNILQIAHNVRAARERECTYREFGAGEWSIAQSQITLPLSDVALVPVGHEDRGIIEYMLPIGPHLLLECRFRTGATLNLEEASWKREVTARSMDQDEAEHVVDTICSSAIREIVSSTILEDVADRRTRAKASGLKFCRSTNPQAVAQAGLIQTDGAVAFQMVPEEDYVEYAESFILPPE